MQPGDAIVAIDGRPIKQTAELGAIVATKSAGDKVRVTFIRDGREQTAEGDTLGPSEQKQAANRSPNAPKRFAEGAKAMQEKNYSRARELIGELFLLDKEDNGAWYDLACIEALDGHPDKALDCLKKAVDYGYANFRHIEHDPDLDSIRSSPQYKDFSAHNDRYQRARAAKIGRG